MNNAKNVLIIGGTSSLSKDIVKLLEANEYTIQAMTFRQSSRVYGDYKWVPLDLIRLDQVNEIIGLMNANKYSKIIFLSGGTLDPNIKEHSYETIEYFYKSFIMHYSLLIQESSKSLDRDGQIIFISSRAANLPSSDPYYSAAKAGIQAFVRSISLILKENQSAFSIAPGAIDSSIKDQIAKIIAEADKSYNGRVIEIGY
jgi:NAD(P)-dependent dehydrogenase (short-subunit alcohol dehydrogenase family)